MAQLYRCLYPTRPSALRMNVERQASYTARPPNLY